MLVRGLGRVCLRGRWGAEGAKVGTGGLRGWCVAATSGQTVKLSPGPRQDEEGTSSFLLTRQWGLWSSAGYSTAAAAAAAVPSFPGASEPLKLNNISDNKGARRKRKRVGRGIGSGWGKTCGRGHKGQKARSGGRPRLGFEGGQTPLRLRLPKRGFHNPHKREYQWLNLYKLSSWIRQGRIDPTKLITMKTLRDTGVVGNKIKDGVKLLGAGHAKFNHKISIEVSSCSELAREAIEKQGGQVQLVYYNKLGLKALMKPWRFEVTPFPARPPPKLRYLFEYVGRLPEPDTPITK